MLLFYRYIKKNIYLKLNIYSVKLIFCIFLIFLLTLSCKNPAIFKGKDWETFRLINLTASENNFKSLYGAYRVKGDLEIAAIQFFPFHIRTFSRSTLQTIYYYSRPDDKTLYICEFPSNSLDSLKNLSEIRQKLCSRNDSTYIYHIKSADNSRLISLTNMTTRSLFGYHKNDVLLERSTFSTLMNSQHQYKDFTKETISLISQENFILTLPPGNPLSNRSANLYTFSGKDISNDNKISINAIMTPGDNTLFFNVTSCGSKVIAFCQTNRTSTYHIRFLDKQKIEWRYLSGNKLFNRSTIVFWIPSMIPPSLKSKIGSLIKNSLENKKFRSFKSFEFSFSQININSEQHQYSLYLPNKDSSVVTTSFKFKQDPNNWQISFEDCSSVTSQCDSKTSRDIFFNFDFNEFSTMNRSLANFFIYYLQE